MNDTPATQAENEALACACEAVADAASAGVEWVGLATAQVREEGPALARELRRGAIRARKLAEAARRPMCVSVFGPSQSGKSYLISASVVRLDSMSEDKKLRASCTVSATLRDAERGTILATLEGRARAEDAATKGERAERDALAAAAQGAVNAIPEAIRRAE